MKKIVPLIIIILLIISFLPIFNGWVVYTGACYGDMDCSKGSSGPFITKTNFWKYLEFKMSMFKEM